jgi:hypothetical protein
MFIAALLLLLTIQLVSQGQVITDLPEYSTKFYLVAVYNDLDNMTVRSAKLHNFMRQNPHMRKLTSQTIYHEWDSKDEIVNRTKWRAFLGDERPALLLLGVAKSNGTADPVFFAYGANLRTGDQLVKSIHESLTAYQHYLSQPSNQRGRWRCTPQGCFPRQDQQRMDRDLPEQQPDLKLPRLDQTVDVQLPDMGVSVDVGKDEKPANEDSTEEEEGIPLVAIILTLLGAAGAGAYSELKKGQDS